MTIAAQPGVPTTLADLLRNLRDSLQEMGDNTPLLVGSNYIARGPGDPGRRIVIDPYLSGSKIAVDARELGSAGSVTGKCEVRVRGDDSADDIARLDDCERLTKRVWACLRAAAPGHVDGGPLEDISPVDVSGYGFELAFTFTYRFDAWHESDRWEVQTAADNTAQTPQVPGGEPMGGVLEPTVTPN